MTIEVSILLSVLSIVIAFLGYQLNKQKNQAESHKDIEKEAKKEAVLETKLDNISNGVESIRIGLKANEQRIGDLSGTVIRIEESTKQAHKRIDKLEGRGV